MKFTVLEDEGNVTDIESAPTLTPTSPHTSSSMTPKDKMNSLEQRSSGKIAEEPTIDGGLKKFGSLVEIYVDALEE